MNKDLSRSHVHRAKVAGISGLLIPGAAQAYNGRLFRGAFILITAPLLFPWMIGLITGIRQAKRINDAGGRIGFGGRAGLILHLWFAVNVALLTLVGLSMSGVLT